MTNDPPYFTSAPLSTVNIEWFNPSKLVLPSIKDDKGQPITVTSVEHSKSSLPRLMKFDASTLTYDLAPIATDTSEKYNIQIKLSDSSGASKSYTFDVIVFP